MIDGKLLTDEETEPLWGELEKIQARITKDARPVVQDQPWKLETQRHWIGGPLLKRYPTSRRPSWR